MSDSEEADVRFIRALKACESIAPGLSALASALSGKKTRVIFSRSDSATDGKTIWLKPDVRLGDKIPHNRKLCDQRDPVTHAFACEACGLLDQVTAVFYHEIGHKIQGSFAAMPDLDKVVDRVTPFLEPRQALALRTATFSDYTFMEASASISKWMPFVLNVFEDARVNRKMTATRPGLRRSFTLAANSILSEGIENADGSRSKWSDRSIDMQMLIGSFLAASDFTGCLANLDTQVGAFYARPDALDIANRHTESVADAFDQAFDMFLLLRSEGFLKDDEQSSNESESGPGRPGESQEGESQDGESQDGESDGESQDGESGKSSKGEPDGESQDGESDGESRDGESDGESRDGESQDGESQDGDHEPGKSGGSVDGKATATESKFEIENLMKTLAGHGSDFEFDNADWSVAELQQLHRATTEIRGRASSIGEVEFHAWPEGLGYWIPSFAVPEEAVAPSQTLLGVTVAKSRMIFQENQASHFSPGQRRGRFYGPHASRLIAGDVNVFGRRITPDERSFHVLIGLDVSGSTDATLMTGRERRIDLIRRAGYSLAEVMARLDVGFSVYGHSGRRRRGYGTGEFTMDLLELKAPGARWDATAKQAVRALQPQLYNLDGHTMQEYRKIVEGQRVTRKVIIYLTDGEMPAANRNDELPVLKSEILRCRESGISLIGIGVETDSPKEHGLDTLILNSIDDLPKLIAGIGERLTAI